MSLAAQDPRDLDDLLSQVRFRPRSSLGVELVGRWDRGEGPRQWKEGPSGVARWLGASVLLVALIGFASWSRLGRHPDRTVDHCCQDLDGGGQADDGVVVKSRRGSEIERLSVYEDRDGSRSFTPADTLRFEREGHPIASRMPGAALKSFEFCCLDYDGGGADDDALVVVAAPPDRIAMAAIYEWRNGAGDRLLR
jgi:hypothetical protein